MEPIARLTRRTGADELRDDAFPAIRTPTHHISHLDEDDEEGMSSFLDVIVQVTKFSLHYDDDFFDRLSHRYTLAVLIIATIITGSKQYVGDPIDCWVPAHFTGSHSQYTENICWIMNTYYVPYKENIPFDVRTREDRELSYYQWVPFILLSMAFLFYCPHILWRLFNARVGLDVSGIVSTINTIEHLNPDNREKTTKFLVRHMDRYFDVRKDFSGGCCSKVQTFLAEKMCLLIGKKYGNQMIFVYIFVKLLYIGNAIAQLFLLNAFLKTDYNFYGIEVIEKLINGTDFTESKRFPRITMCDFEIRRMGGMVNTHRYTVQCALPVNLFSEKIFIFLWFWLVLVAAFSAWGLLPWIFTLFRRARLQYVKKYLKMGDQLNSNADGKLAKAFADRYLRQDGVFVLRLVSKNSNDIVITDIMLSLWEHFKKFRRNYHPNKPDAV